MPPKIRDYIQGYIIGKFSSNLPTKELLHRFVSDPNRGEILTKIMERANAEILREWKVFSEPKSWKPPLIEETPPPPPSPTYAPPLHKTSSPITIGSHAVNDQIKTGATPPVMPHPAPLPSRTQTQQAGTAPQMPSIPKQPPAAPTPTVPQLGSNISPTRPAATAPTSPTPVIPKPAVSMNVSFRMLNAKVGIPYASALEVTTPNVTDIAIVKVDGLENAGLAFDSATMKVVGNPTKSGDFSLIVWFSKLGDSAQIASKCNLTVNPDPKSLWQNTPSDSSGLYAKPDEDKWLIKSPDHVLVGASKRGRSHAHTGIYRDDDFFIGHVKETGWDISVVSDGAGSCKYSRRGSELICKDGGERLHLLLSGDDGKKLTDAVADYKAALDAGQAVDAAEANIRNALWTTIGYAAHHATKRLQDEMADRTDLNAVMKDYSSTALFGIAKKFSFGTLCAAYWVGDGAVAVMKEDGTHILLGEADGGEYSGQTRFLSPEFVKPDELTKRLRFALVPDFKALVLMTDGVSDPYFETDAGLNNASKWKELWDELEGSVDLSKRGDKLDERILSWLDFWSAGNHDDRTLALIY